MAGNVKVCDVDPDLKEKIKKFRFRKATNNAAIIMKVDKARQMVVLDEEYEDYSVEQVSSELPESQPRYVLYSYEFLHDDGRKSYPMCLIFVTPQGCNPEQQMLYAGSVRNLVSEAGLTKVFEIRNVEEFTEEWLRECLRFYR